MSEGILAQMARAKKSKKVSDKTAPKKKAKSNKADKKKAKPVNNSAIVLGNKTKF